MGKLTAASGGQDLRSKLQKSEEDLASLQGELDHVQQLATLGTLTAGIAHEINNILTPVLAYAQLAAASPGDGALVAKALGRAIAGVESASRITEAVLGFARGDGTDQELAPLARVVEAAFNCIGRDPARDGITLELDVEPQLNVRIAPLCLQQVLLNLFLNAISAMKGRPGTLRVLSKTDQATARIVVSDTGPGIPVDLLPRLFDPFVSGAKRDTGKPNGLGGTGLGLAVCKRMIENAGGTIQVDSKPGVGASFTITLSSQ